MPSAPCRNPAPAGDRSGSATQRNVAIVLGSEFSLVDFAVSVEALQMANVISGQNVYQCALFSAMGGVVSSSCGVSVETRSVRLLDHRSVAFAIVCAGVNFEGDPCSIVSSHLVRLRRHGGAVGGIAGGAFVLASAGLLEGRTCSLPAYHEDSFRSRFPAIPVTRSIFACHGDVFTCSGGAATLDLMLHAIADDHGRALSSRVSSRLNHVPAPEPASRQAPRTDLHGARDQLVAQALIVMEQTWGEPITPGAIASQLGVPLRRMERRFKRELGLAPLAVYTQIRLRKAEHLLTQTPMPITEIAAACGYQSPSHFTRAFSRAYGVTPMDYRRQRRLSSPILTHR